jgi:hypothetical protein
MQHSPQFFSGIITDDSGRKVRDGLTQLRSRDKRSYFPPDNKIMFYSLENQKIKCLLKNRQIALNRLFRFQAARKPTGLSDPFANFQWPHEVVMWWQFGQSNVFTICFKTSRFIPRGSLGWISLTYNTSRFYCLGFSKQYLVGQCRPLYQIGLLSNLEHQDVATSPGKITAIWHPGSVEVLACDMPN